MANKILCAKNLVTSIGGSVLHDHLNLDLHEGEILGLVGGSGTGKSVLLRVILGLMKASSGTITSYTRDGSALPGLEEMGVLFQSGALFSSLSVSENIQVPLKEKANLSPQLCEEIAVMKIAMVGLPPDTYHKYPSELSGGMIKRAALARSLAMDPRLLFLDEPTAGLDPISAQGFDELILSLRERLNLSVLMVTHDLDSLVTICDRIAVLVDKKIVVGSLEELYENPHPWIQSYFLGKRGRAAKKTDSTA